MSIALLVSSHIEGADQQTLIFPYEGEVRIYNRTSTGQAGRAESWNLTDTNSLPETTCTQSPVAVVLTDRDLELIKGGLVTNIGAKALYALESMNSSPT
jgi:hypothetical protein